MLYVKRRKIFVAAVALPVWAAISKLSIASAVVVEREIPNSKSLQNDIANALKATKPLVVLVSLDHCQFCKVARENYLLPLMREQAIPVVQINFGYSTPIVDALGKRTTQAELIAGLQIKTAPTILFLGKNGQELSPRLVGGTTSDFYGAYLDERLRIAQAAISHASGLR
jgi:thioredoxin-related protein